MKKHLHVIQSIVPGSIAEEMELQPGDTVLAINGQDIEDVFDYHYLVNDEYVEMLIRTADGTEEVLEIEKDYDEDIGIVFESSLMDDIAPAAITVFSALSISFRRACVRRCISRMMIPDYPSFRAIILL